VHQSVPPKQRGFGNQLWRFLRNRYTLALLLCLFVINARLFTIKRFGVQEPYMDSFSEVHYYKAIAENDYGAVCATHWNCTTNTGLSYKLFLLERREHAGTYPEEI
jgi:hypothetical protein